MVLAFERLDNCTHRLPAQNNVRTLKICTSEKNSFISLSARHFRSSSARSSHKVKQQRDHNKNSYKLFKLNKKATTLFAFSTSSSQCAPSLGSNTRGLFIIVYGHSTSGAVRRTTHVFTQKQGEEEKRNWTNTMFNVDDYTCEASTVGNSKPNHSQEMNSWIKDGCTQSASSCLKWSRAQMTLGWGKFFTGDGVMLASRGVRTDSVFRNFILRIFFHKKFDFLLQ